MDPKSNEYGNNSFEARMGNMSLGDEPPSLPKHQYHGQQQFPNFMGNWNQAQGGHVEDDDEDDEQPLSYSAQQSQQQNNNYSRPVSVRNMAISANSAKPSNFIKPAAPQSNKSIVPQDMHVIQDLYENYSQKVYLEGYLLKKNDLTVDGKPMGDPIWSNFYVELCGPVLTLWDTAEGNTDENIMPHYINITDSTVELIGRSGEPGRENVFSLNSAGANRYLFDVPDYNALLNWICAIRLSCFECSRLHEIYTRNFITRPIYSDILVKPMNKMEGFVQVRFTGTTEWIKYWVVVSDRKEEKKLFGKKSVQSRGQMMFYESKKSKHPVMTMVNVVQTYTIYPESPQLIDLATMMKVEGSTFTVKSNGEQQPAAPTAALIMASSPKELVQWIIGTYDTFKLYGRPTKLIDDSSNINSLNFGEPMNGNLPRLFLEVPEVIHVNCKDENLIDNKAKFAGILLQKLQQKQQPQGNYRQPQQPMGLIHQIPGNQLYNNQSPSSTQRMSVMSGYPNPQQQQLRSMGNQSPHQPQQQQQQQRSNLPPGHVIYASDEDSEEEEEEEEEEDSDNDSIFKPENNITRESLSLPALSTEDDGFANSILGDIEKKKEVAPIDSPVPTSAISSNVSLPIKSGEPTQDLKVDDKGKQPANGDDDFGISDSEDETPRPVPTAVRRPKPKMAPTQISLSGSDESGSEDEEDDDEEGSYSGSDDDVPIHGKRQQDQHLQQQQQQQMYYNQFDDYGNPQMQPQWDQNNMYPDEQAFYDEDGYPMADEDGPIIPQLGDRFATQNSLLDSYRPDHPSARDQEGYARATGQPLIQVPNKPPEPRAGLVGMISQIEHEKKFKEANKNRFVDMEKDRMMDRERERYMMEQRAQMMPMGMNMMNQPMMNQPMMGQPMMNQSMMNQPMMNQSMMDPRMMMNMQMMGGQMPMMGMMDPRMSMMYSGMNPAMMQQSGSMMNLPMMNPMMDPRMSMMMMQQQYGQYPMWSQQQSMYGNNRFNNDIQEDDDEDDDVPLGAKDSPIPHHNN